MKLNHILDFFAIFIISLIFTIWSKFSFWIASFDHISKPERDFSLFFSPLKIILGHLPSNIFRASNIHLFLFDILWWWAIFSIRLLNSSKFIGGQKYSRQSHHMDLGTEGREQKMKIETGIDNTQCSLRGPLSLTFSWRIKRRDAAIRIYHEIHQVYAFP